MLGDTPHVAMICQNAMSERDYRRFGIPMLLQRGCRVSVVDIADIMRPRTVAHRSNYPNLTGVNFIVASTSKEIMATVPLLATADVIYHFAEGGYVEPENLTVFQALTKAGRPYLTFAANAFPAWDRGLSTAGLGRRLRDAFGRRQQIKLSRSLLAKLPLSLLGLRPVDYVVVGGRISMATRLGGPKTKMIQAHTMDYDIFLDERHRDEPVEDVAVFLDEFRPFHPDVALQGYDRIVDPELYYAQLRQLFDRIEAELGLKVVVAANPLANYHERPDLFGGREVLRMQTARQVLRSRLVIAHRSTAIGWAIMAHKPIMLIATQENYLHPTQRPYFDGFAAALGKPIIFYDNPTDVDLSTVMTKDDSRYDAYLSTYVKQPGSPDLPIWEIVYAQLCRDDVIRPSEGNIEGTSP